MRTLLKKKCAAMLLVITSSICVNAHGHNDNGSCIHQSHEVNIHTTSDNRLYESIILPTVGNFNFPEADRPELLAVGCDADVSGQLGWRDEVANTRIYDGPLTDGQATQHLHKVKDCIDTPDTFISNTVLYSGLPVKIGIVYLIRGEGFADGDIIELVHTQLANRKFTLSSTKLGNIGVNITIPSRFVSGKYKVTVIRDEKRQQLGFVTLNVVERMPKSAKVIAHRGFWNTQGSAQNSRTALRNALDINAYGAEIDIWLTPDGHLMLNHDMTYQGKVIMDTPAEECRKLILPNGETMPEITEMFEIMKNSNSPTKLIIEIKSHNDDARNKAAASAAVKAVKAAGMQHRVEYISFSDVVCEQIIADDPKAKVAALSGGVAPSVRHAKGFTGIDYHINEFRNNPQWVEEAQKLGMEVNVWTVNSTEEMAEMSNLGVDYITTDFPVEAIDIKNYLDSFDYKDN